MNKMKIKIFTLFSLIITFSLAITSCNSLWDDLNTLTTATITYVSDKGTPPVKKEVNIGYRLTAEDLPDLTSDGYNFKGWDKSIDDEITTDTTITASWKKTCKITYVLPSGYSKDPKVVEEGYKLTAEDLPNETETEYGTWDKTVGTEITADTIITATNWETIVYLKNFKGIIDLAFSKSNFEKTIFTEDTYTGDTTNTIGCADDINNPKYFTGVISSDNKVFTIYGNGHRIYAPVDSSQLFSGFNKVNSIELNNFYTSNVTNMMAMFAGTKLTSLDVSKFNTSKVTDMTGMFETCEDITSLDLSSFDTSSVTNMTKMFKECKNLTTLNVSSFDTSKVTDMSSMFDQCEKLVSLNLSKFKTSEVTTMGSMFQGCEKLTSLDLSSFDTSSVTDMGGMFYSCKELTSLDVSKFDTSSVSNMKSMFEGCEKITVLDISSFDFSSMPEGKSFKDADFYVFKNCSSLVTIYATNNFKFTFNSVFEGCSKLVGGAGTACNGTDNINASYACIDTASTPGYFTLKQ